MPRKTSNTLEWEFKKSQQKRKEVSIKVLDIDKEYLESMRNSWPWNIVPENEMVYVLLWTEELLMIEFKEFFQKKVKLKKYKHLSERFDYEAFKQLFIDEFIQLKWSAYGKKHRKPFKDKFPLPGEKAYKEVYGL